MAPRGSGKAKRGLDATQLAETQGFLSKFLKRGNSDASVQSGQGLAAFGFVSGSLSSQTATPALEDDPAKPVKMEKTEKQDKKGKKEKKEKNDERVSSKRRTYVVERSTKNDDCDSSDDKPLMIAAASDPAPADPAPAVACCDKKSFARRLAETHIDESTSQSDLDTIASEMTKGIAELAEAGKVSMRGGGGAEEEQPETEEDHFWKAVKEADFAVPARAHAGNALASRFQRKLSTDKAIKEQYASCGGRESRAAFRAEWARERYQEYSESKRRVQRHSVSSSRIGTLYTLERIAKEEGGGPKGMAAAVNIALSCIEEEEPGWVEYDPRAKNVKYFYTLKTSEDKFSDEWTKSRSWHVPAAPSTELCVAGRAAVEPKSSSATAVEPKSSPTPKKKATAKLPTKGSSPSVVDLSDAKKTKLAYTTAMMQADQLLKNIQSEGSWAWARVLTQGVVEAKLAVDRAVAGNMFAKRVLAESDWMQSVKKDLSGADLSKALKTFSVDLDDALKILSVETRLLQVQQQARLSVK